MNRQEFEIANPLGSVVVQENNAVRPMNQDEWTAWVDDAMAAQATEQAEADALVAKEAARQSGIDKLTALGLTVDEVSAVFGI